MLVAIAKVYAGADHILRITNCTSLWEVYQATSRGFLVWKTTFVYEKELIDSDIWHC